VFLNIRIDWIILKTYDQQFTLTSKKSLHIIFKTSAFRIAGTEHAHVCLLKYRQCLIVSLSQLPQLRPVMTGQLAVPRTKTTSGDQTFTINSPAVWDSLPAEPRSQTSLTSLGSAWTRLYFTHYRLTLPSVLWRRWLGGRKGIRPVKIWGMVEVGAG